MTSFGGTLAGVAISFARMNFNLTYSESFLKVRIFLLFIRLDLRLTHPRTFISLFQIHCSNPDGPNPSRPEDDDNLATLISVKDYTKDVVKENRLGLMVGNYFLHPPAPRCKTSLAMIKKTH